MMMPSTKTGASRIDESTEDISISKAAATNCIASMRNKRLRDWFSKLNDGEDSGGKEVSGSTNPHSTIPDLHAFRNKLRKIPIRISTSSTEKDSKENHLSSSTSSDPPVEVEEKEGEKAGGEGTSIHRGVNRRREREQTENEIAAESSKSLVSQEEDSPAERSELCVGTMNVCRGWKSKAKRVLKQARIEGRHRLPGYSRVRRNGTSEPHREKARLRDLLE
jgi:hypothetical protein